jgi:TPR repeat protein
MTRNYFRLFLIIVLSLLGLGCSELEFKEGQENFLKQDYRSAFIRLTPAARAGNPQAQYAIGYMYYTGQGTVKDRQKAKEWIEKAAKQGNKNAISALTRLQNQAHSPYLPSSNPKMQPL